MLISLLIVVSLIAQKNNFITDYNEALKSPLSVIKLDLKSDTHLKNIPASISLFTNLKVLKINNPNIINISKNIGDLKALKNLVIGNNLIINKGLKTLPSSLSKLSSLFYINLNGLPNLDFNSTFKFIAHNKKLKILALMNNNFTHLPEKIVVLKHVKWIFLGRNSHLNFTDVFNKLEKMDLERIGFAHSGLSEISKDILKLKTLKSIYLVGNKLKSIKILQALPKLNRLLLDDNLFSKIEFNIKTIKVLSLADNKHLNITSLIHSILKSKKLSYLNLSNIKEIPLNPYYIRNKSITELNISKNKLKEFPQFIYQLKALKKLTITDTNISRYQISQFKRSFPNIKIIQ